MPRATIPAVPTARPSAHGGAGAVPSRRADGFLHRRLDVGEVTLHLAEARPSGCPDDAPVPAAVPLVVLCHGFPESWWSWRHQMTALAAAGAWVVAPDQRGYHESDKPPDVGAYEVERLVGDVAGVIRGLGRERAIVVGHDWGGIVAWVLAETHPAMVERLAILNCPHPLTMRRGFRRPSQLRKSWYMFFFQLPFGIPERAIARDDFAYLRRILLADGLTPEDVVTHMHALGAPGALTAALHWYRAAIRRVVTGRTPAPRPISCPTLVIWGDRDRYLGRELSVPPAAFVAAARIVHIPDASHWVQQVAADRVSALLIEHAIP